MLFVFFVFLISPRLCPLVMSKRQKQFSEKVRNHDKIIQVGGSFFVDSYGPMQFEYILISLVAKKPTYLVGHSYGPFNTFLSRLLAKTLLSRVTKNFYREQQSAQMLTALGIDNAEYGVDTAWLVPSTGTKEKSNCVALTLRELSPFDRVLGFSQQEFEDKVTSLAQSILNLNYKLIFVSTCTSLGGYWKDDRVVAKRVAKRLQLQDRVQVIEDDLNDIDIGRKLSECVLTIGTRLHSAIISMNFGTPAYTIYYEPKSLGIMERVIDADHCLLIPDLDLKNTLEKIESTLNNIDKVEQQMAQKVIAEKAIAKKMITSVLEERDD
jgi:colanic acid/amylovoran biosynthesis protein